MFSFTIQVNLNESISGPLQGLKIRGARSIMVGIICPLGRDRVNCLAKILRMIVCRIVHLSTQIYINCSVSSQEEQPV